ncbi:MAG: DUF3833 family protein [Pseudomonadota bacterium]
MNMISPIEQIDDTQEFTLERLFVGTVDMMGYVVDFRGQITRRFVAEATGHLGDKGVITIDEELRYLGDGEPETRQWVLTPRGTGYRAETHQLVGPGTIKRVSASTLEWSYDIKIPVNGNEITVKMVDQMVGLGDGRATALTKITKFGLPVGKIVSSYVRRTTFSE